VTLSPSATQWVKPGSAVTYTVTVKNNDNAGCTASDLTNQATPPSGWTTAFGSPGLNVAPGGSVSTTLTVTSPTTAADGFYTIGVTTINSADTSYAASTSVTQALLSSLSVGVTTNQASYTRNQTVAMSATVTTNGQPLANASVTFTVTKANGTKTTGTATTGTNGVAVYKLRLKRRDPAGTYGVNANASANSVSGSAATSFTVQ